MTQLHFVAQLFDSRTCN